MRVIDPAPFLHPHEAWPEIATLMECAKFSEHPVAKWVCSLIIRFLSSFYNTPFIRFLINLIFNWVFVFACVVNASCLCFICILSKFFSSLITDKVLITHMIQIRVAFHEHADHISRSVIFFSFWNLSFLLIINFSLWLWLCCLVWTHFSLIQNSKSKGRCEVGSRHHCQCCI